MKKNKLKNKVKPLQNGLVDYSRIDNNIWKTLLAMLVLIPLTIKMHPTDHISPIIGDHFEPTGFTIDVFSYYKYALLLLGTSILIMFFLTKMVSKGYTLKQDNTNLPLFIFMVLVLLSAIFADYKHLALIGMYNRYESALAFLCYGFIFLIAANITYTEKKVTYIIRALYPVAFINTILGLTWFYGTNILDYEAVRKFLTPSTMPLDTLTGYILATLPNPNYVSGIGAVLCCIFVTKAIFDRNLIDKVINLIFATMSFALILTSLSTSGFVTIVIALPVLVLFMLKSNTKKNAFITLAIVLVIFTGTYNVLNAHNERVRYESIGFFTEMAEKAKAKIEASKPEEIKPEEIEQEAPPVQEPPAEDPITEEPQVEEPKVEEAPLVDIATEFNLPASGTTFGSGRGYIWAETLKLIKQNPIFGYGFDTYPFHFPQNDPNKITGLYTMDVTVDKPHNFYLGLAYSAGIVTLLAFLSLIFINIYRHFKIYLTGINSELKYLIATLFMGWLAFLIQWIFNDSRIGTTFIFWIIFGVSTSLIRGLSQDENQELP
ncbi:intein C-terminal splicing region [Desulfonispora thiosulfatigenes DSM 11270]|uniref:Intein C-terminal splicing region n=1 Tax=Desulfonispora thiosulfatigenes DSM 11270 TaxID=656914 RepID=A0A1W1V4P3_DESTI|nr:O-antigen ligase family protein [Desulfonispora thiosulfatigenes]SMB88292.1 intein C-terminal splicing region [Desulfonispora thiosulfatigenes DSM 11270]